VIQLKPLVRLNSCKVDSNVAVYSAVNLFFCVLLQEHDEHDEL